MNISPSHISPSLSKLGRAQSSVFHESVLGGSIAELPDRGDVASSCCSPGAATAPSPSRLSANTRVSGHSGVGVAMKPHPTETVHSQLDSVATNGGIASATVACRSLMDVWPLDIATAPRNSQTAGFKQSSSSPYGPSATMQRSVGLVQDDFRLWQRQQLPQAFDDPIRSLSTSLTHSPGRGGVYQRQGALNAGPTNTPINPFTVEPRYDHAPHVPLTESLSRVAAMSDRTASVCAKTLTLLNSVEQQAQRILETYKKMHAAESAVAARKPLGLLSETALQRASASNAELPQPAPTPAAELPARNLASQPICDTAMLMASVRYPKVLQVTGRTGYLIKAHADPHGRPKKRNILMLIASALLSVVASVTLRARSTGSALPPIIQKLFQIIAAVAERFLQTAAGSRVVVQP